MNVRGLGAGMYAGDDYIDPNALPTWHSVSYVTAMLKGQYCEFSATMSTRPLPALSQAAHDPAPLPQTRTNPGPCTPAPVAPPPHPALQEAPLAPVPAAATGSVPAQHRNKRAETKSTNVY